MKQISDLQSADCRHLAVQSPLAEYSYVASLKIKLATVINRLPIIGFRVSRITHEET